MAKLLLVEDDNNLREIYEARLSAEGYDISTAQNGEEALSIAKQLRPDLIISDVMMPRISGFEMLDILRNTDELKSTKIIMLTALGQAEDRGRADNLGADRYLVKSQVTLEDIVQAAHELLEGTAEPAPEVAATPAPAAPAVPAVEATPEVEPMPAAEPLAAAPAVPEVITPAAPVVTPEPVAVSPVPPVSVTPDPSVIEPPVAAEPVLPVAEPTAVDTAVPEPVAVAPSLPAPADDTTASDDIVVPAPDVAVSSAPAVVVPIETAAVPSTPAEAPVLEPVAPVTAPEAPSVSPTPEPVVSTPTEAEQAANDAVLEAAINNLTEVPAAVTPAPVAPAVPVAEPAPVAGTPEAAEAPAEPSSTEITGRKVITPITDPSEGPDINALLAQAEAEEAVPVTAAPAPAGTVAPSADVVAPQAPAPAATPTNGVDPNSIAL